MAIAENLKIPNPTEGIIRAAAIADPVSQENSVQEAVNFHFDSMGVMTGRPGLTQYADVPSTSNPILSYGAWSQNATSNRKLLAQQGTAIYALSAGTWSSVRSGLVANNKARYAQYLNLTYMINGYNGDAIQSFNGTTFSATNVGSFAANLSSGKGDFINAGFEGRIWIVDRSLDRLYYSDVVSPTGVITGGTEYIERLSPQDGQSITGLMQVDRALLVFKQNSIFRVYSASSVDPYPAYYLGTYSQESIIKTEDGVFFHHPTGFYKFVYGAQPQNISRRIIDFVENILRVNYEQITGWSDQDHIYWSCGDITIKGKLYRNCVCRYTMSTNVWTIYSYANTITATIIYDDGTSILPLVGTNLGITARTDIGTSDMGSKIFVEGISRWITFSTTASPQKQITGAAAIHQNCAGMKVDFQFDKDDPNKFQTVMTLKDNYADPFPNIDVKDFSRMRYRISGSYDTTVPVFETIEILKLVTKGPKNN